MSGLHRGRWARSDDTRTVIFQPVRDFKLGETVTVSLNMKNGDSKALYSHYFKIKKEIVEPEPDIFDEYEDIPLSAGEARDLTGYQRVREQKKKHFNRENSFTLPPDFPAAVVTVCDNPAEGKIFLANKRARWSNNRTFYLMILDNTGFPEFFRKTVTPGNDFKKQPNGMITYALRHTFHFYVMDNTYTVVDSFTAKNDMKLDFHDFIMMDNGNVLLIAKEFHTLDMSEMVEGGDPEARVITNVIQEIDKSKNLVFQWRTIDHFDILDTNIDLTRRRVDYAHINAVEVDYDGNLLISSRHMSEVTKINRETGEVMWRLGGPNNDFTLADDTQWFSRQHDIRRLPNGNVTLYDNGFFNEPQNSRAIEYSLDMENMVAARIWDYCYDPIMFIATQGNAQRLPNGNTLIGWGNTWKDEWPEVVEAKPDGSKAFELFLDGTAYSYRGYRFPWEGKAARPYAWADTTGGGITLHFAKFGDDRVAQFHAYRAAEENATFKFAATSGYSVPVHEFTAGEPLYLRVKSVGRRGNESEFSNQLKIVPGFSDSLPTVAASVDIHPNTLNLSSRGRWITALISFPAGSEYLAEDIERCSIMLNDTVLADRTGGLEEMDGDTLMAKFPRKLVVAAIAEGGTAEIRITGYLPGARFEGYDEIRVLDKDGLMISRRELNSSEDNGLSAIDLRNYPNPFNPETVISFSLPSPGSVELNVYDVQGKLITTLAEGRMTAGAHQIRWNGRNSLGESMASGIYFYRLNTGSQTVTRKMILLR